MKPLQYGPVMAEILQRSVQFRTAELTEYVLRETGRIVQRGPFEGMILPEQASWGSGDVLPKVLGTYEQELHQVVECAITRNPKAVFNVGCAEGYYAVGFARRLPEAAIHAFDTDCAAIPACLAAFHLNKVTFAGVGGNFTPQRVSEWETHEYPSLIFMDVEGAELEILREDQIWHLKNADLIVECHDFVNPDITRTLIQRLEETHTIELIGEGPRDPNIFPLLRNVSSLDRWLAVSENRPCSMHWMAAWSKER